MSLNFEKYQAEANGYLNQVQYLLQTPDREQAGRVFRAILHALRDRLPEAIAADLAAQLPLIWKGVFYDGYKPGKTPVDIKTREEFIEFIREKNRSAIEKDFPTDEHVLSALKFVMLFLRVRTSEGLIEKIISVVPNEIKDIIQVPVLHEIQ